MDYLVGIDLGSTNLKAIVYDTEGNAVARASRPADQPMYDFNTHKRVSSTRRLVPKEIIIIEGILIFVDNDLRDLMDIKVFIDTDAETNGEAVG